MVNGKVIICTHEHYEKCIKVLVTVPIEMV